MIVVDTSVFLDELFKFDQKRHDKARILFRLIEDKEVLILEPEIFRVELIGQLVRRMVTIQPASQNFIFLPKYHEP